MLNYCRACHIFKNIFPIILSLFVEMRPHMVTLRNFDGTIFYIMTCFTSVPNFIAIGRKI